MVVDAIEYTIVSLTHHINKMSDKALGTKGTSKW